MIRETLGVPLVIVPVLSKNTVSTFGTFSRYFPPFTRMPREAALPIAALKAAGVERAMPQGQTIISILMARLKERVKRYVTKKRLREMGTTVSANLSAVRMASDSRASSLSIILMIEPMRVSSPIILTLTVISPISTWVPATTLSPAFL